MIEAFKKLIIAWAASILFALWSGLMFIAGLATCYFMAIQMLAAAR